MRLLHAVARIVFSAALLFGCADKSAEQDVQTKQKLVGTWYSTWTDTDFGDTHHLLVKVRDDGTFDARTVVFYKDSSRKDEATSGEWFVTAGLFKRLHKVRERKQLGASDYSYETCRIVTLIEAHLDCVYDVANGQNNYERVQDSFQITAK